jgi:cytochrome b561
MAVRSGYSALQIRLHWIVAVLVVLQLVFGEEIGSAYRTLRTTGVATYDINSIGHIVGGVLILAFVLWRLVLRRVRGVPPAPKAPIPLFEFAAAVAHAVLYALMVLAPITGLIAWFGQVSLMAEVHELMKPLFIILIAGHVVAALWHHFWLKDGLLLRMKTPRD